MKVANFIIIILLAFPFFEAKAQETETPKSKAVRAPFESGYLIDQQTGYIPYKKTLEFVIQHRFGLINKEGISDLFGIYAPGSNIRMGLNYSLTDNLMVGYGITKKNMYNDFQIKWTALKQTRSNSIPIALTLYGDAAINGKNEKEFGKNYKFISRLSYFGQVIVGRKFTDWLSLQIASSYTHYNMVDTNMVHDVIGLSFNGRVRFSPQSSFIFEYDYPFQLKGNSEKEATFESKPNLSFGIEISTSTHAFQVYLTTADGILLQDVMMYNNNDWVNGDLMIGFTITRLWSF
ncbi:MAG: hypothetical protein B6D61_04535 [Bacteroidetes bacterium 4484_249]|nr:MAG: hypothetical protein B6D61_04535 [Bacteroidetes bacterium 4484_249]